MFNKDQEMIRVYISVTYLTEKSKNPLNLKQSMQHFTFSIFQSHYKPDKDPFLLRLTYQSSPVTT